MPENLKDLATGLVREVERYSAALASLNWAAMKAEAEGSLASPELGAVLRRNDFQDLIGWFEAEGLVTMERRRLRFAGEAARFFANGGWLEQYVHAVVQELKRELPPIQDLGRSLQVTCEGRRDQILNELDVAFLADNRLYVIECKTRKFSDDTAAGGPGAEAVYKLDALADRFGGLQARSMLVSYQPLSPHILERARDYRIRTCAYRELPRLKENLQAWLA